MPFWGCPDYGGIQPLEGWVCDWAPFFVEKGLRLWPWMTGGADAMHGRRRRTIDPRIPICNAGAERVGLSRAEQTFARTKREAPRGAGRVA